MANLKVFVDHTLCLRPTLISRLTYACLASAGLIVISASAVADDKSAKPNRYLASVDTVEKLGFVLPPAPPGKDDMGYGDAQEADLDQVRAGQFADPKVKAEAFEDAEAYNYDVLLSRFSVTAGRTLTIMRRPILAHMLRWLLEDVDAYGLKDKFYRDRPFLVDPSIHPCDQSYLMKNIRPPKSSSSYPSGHAAHGYIAAKLLSEVMPDRGDILLARGVRYGTNRVVCGVHFPSDVVMGQAFARYVYVKARSQDEFKKDLVCALEEDDLDRKGQLPGRVWDSGTQSYVAAIWDPSTKSYVPAKTSNFTKDCVSRDHDHFNEAVGKVRDATLNIWPADYDPKKQK